MRRKTRNLMTMLLVAVMMLAATPFTASASLFDRVPSDDSGSNSASAGAAPSSSKYPYSGIQQQIKEYAATNSEAVGWLKVPNTNMDFVITMSKQNNDYYMYRDWKGTYYPNLNYSNFKSFPDTATYLDFRTTLGEGWSNTSRNLILYGHNWNNLRNPFVIGNNASYTMFGQLPSYTSLEFATANPHIYFSTGENEGIWRVFAVGYCEVDESFFYNNPNPSVQNGDFEKLIKGWKERSLHNFDVDVTNSDRIISLSTCTRQYVVNGNPYYDQQRFVVVARLLRDGESENDTVTATANPNPVQPNFT